MDIKEILTLAVGVDRFKEYDRYFMTHCIFPERHNNGDSKPSMKISKKTGTFFCLGCHQKGSLQKFVEHFPHLNLNIGDVKFFMHLAELHDQSRGVRTYESEPDWANIHMRVEGNVQEVADIPEALAYARERGLTDEFINHFEVKASRAATVNGTPFHNRLMIPMFHAGRIVNIEGRDFTRQQHPKVLYPKGCTTNLLLNDNSITPGQALHLVEGMMDVARLFPFTTNVRPLLGSSVKLFQQKQLRDHLKVPGSSIIIWPDHDDAGLGIMRQLDKAAIVYSIAPYPLERKDPGECTDEEILWAMKNPTRPVQMLMDLYGVFKTDTGFVWSTF